MTKFNSWAFMSSWVHVYVHHYTAIIITAFSHKSENRVDRSSTFDTFVAQDGARTRTLAFAFPCRWLLWIYFNITRKVMGILLQTQWIILFYKRVIGGSFEVNKLSHNCNQPASMLQNAYSDDVTKTYINSAFVNWYYQQSFSRLCFGQKT